jgi:predicted enzyme related to lactoylglutathione lyase
MKLRRAIVFAQDMPRMTAFYRDALGLHFLPDSSNEEWAEFDAEGTLLALHAIPDEAATTIAFTEPQRPRSDTPIKLVFEAPDLEGARAHLVAHGAVMLEPHRWGACDGLDPEGNVFQIVTQ